MKEEKQNINDARENCSCSTSKYGYVLWTIFWICLFSYWAYEMFLDHELRVIKSNNDVKLKELDIQDKNLEMQIIKRYRNSLIHLTPDSDVK